MWTAPSAALLRRQTDQHGHRMAHRTSSRDSPQDSARRPPHLTTAVRQRFVTTPLTLVDRTRPPRTVTVDFDVDPDLLMRVRVSPEFGTDPLRLTLSDEPVP